MNAGMQDTIRLAAMKRAARRRRGRKRTNAIMLVLTGLACLLAVVPLVWILAYVIRQGGQQFSLQFLTELPTPVGVPGGGIANALVGSAITVGLALLIAAPLGILGAFYTSMHPNTLLGTVVRFGTDVISGVPSIVVGIFAYMLLVLTQGHFSALAGGVALAIIMLPIVLRTTEEMLRLVPGSLREASLALGAPEWRTMLTVVLPAAADGVVTGLVLAVARAAGEAAPMLFTAFGNPFMNTDINQPVATLPHMIYIYSISPYPDWQAKAWTTALVLIVAVLFLNVLARLLSWLRVRRLGSVIQ